MKYLSVVVCLAVATLLQAQPTTTTPRPAPSSAQRVRMMAEMQEAMIMMQNTAVWTPQGLLILQGNRLLLYSPTLQPVKQVTLPLPPAPATAPATTGVAPAPVLMRGRLTPRLIPIDGGVILIRGTQILRFDTNLNLLNQATLPDLPPLTPAEMTALCPLCTAMQSMGMGMGMAMPTPAPTGAGGK